MTPATRASSRSLRHLWRRQLCAQPRSEGGGSGGHAEVVAVLDALRAKTASCVPPPPWRVLDHTKLAAPVEALGRPPVFVGYSCEGIDAAVRRVFPYTEAARGSHAAAAGQVPRFLGFDLEYTPTFVRGLPVRRTALVQVGNEADTVLAHLYHLLAFPPSLARLLVHPGVVLVGVGVGNDVDKLAADYNVRGANFLDLGIVAELYGYARTGLKSLSAAFGVEVNKSSKVQCGNWERVPLRVQQVEYAALDAQLSLWLLHQLHGTHGRHAPLHVWARPFVNKATLRELCACKQALRPDSPVREAIERHRRGVRVHEQAKWEAKQRVKLQAALARGLQDQESAVSALLEIALTQKADLTWDDSGSRSAVAPAGEVVASVALNQAVLATGCGKTRKIARRVAAYNALRVLAIDADSLTGGLRASAEPQFA
jgi:hypothetical protein